MGTTIHEFLAIGNFLTCIYGKAASGKTNICISTAAKFSKEGKVAFIDTENTFSPKRFHEFGGNLSNLIFYKANSFKEQSKAIAALLPISNKLKLVVIDSLNSHYRTLIQQSPKVNSAFSRHLSELSDLARSNVPVIMTSQVYSTEKGTQMVGSNMLRNWSASIIRLEQENKRSVFIEKHPSEESKSVNFEIKEDSVNCL